MSAQLHLISKPAKWRLLGALCSVAVLAGCGGEDERLIRATLAAADRAWERQDWARLCALHTEAGRQELVRYSINPHAERCIDAFKIPPGSNQSIVTFESPDKRGRIRYVDVNGSTAEAQWTDYTTTWLRKVDGRWLISPA